MNKIPESKKQELAVVIPVYKNKITSDERISFDRCLSILNDYQIILVAPEHLDLDVYLNNDINKVRKIKIYQFNKKFFRNISGYNKLMLSRIFYEKFLEYKYILIYQLDAMIFSDNLLDWCSMNYDYVGAPWVINYFLNLQGLDAQNSCLKFLGVGNGGFSLRKVQSFLGVLDSKNIFQDHYISGMFNPFYGLKYLFLVRLLLEIKKYIKEINFLNIFLFFYQGNEDIFWSYYVKFFTTSFTIADINTALDFAYECCPQGCFEYNNQQLPLGCHGWNKYDREFWIKFLH